MASSAHLRQGQDFTKAIKLARHLETGSCLKVTHIDREILYDLILSHGSWELIHDTNPEVKKALTKKTFQRLDYGRAWRCSSCTRGLHHYHCGNNKCPRGHDTLAELCVYLQNGNCGAISFEAVQETMMTCSNDVWFNTHKGPSESTMEVTAMETAMHE
jgi:hypothetical protein